MAFSDGHIYTPIEIELKKTVLKMFQANYKLEEINFLVERIVYAHLYCDKGLHNKKVGAILGIPEAKAASIRDTFDFIYTLAQKEKELKPAKQEKEQLSPEELKKRVLERLQKEGKVSA